MTQEEVFLKTEKTRFIIKILDHSCTYYECSKRARYVCYNSGGSRHLYCKEHTEKFAWKHRLGNLILPNKAGEK